ncbi:methyl-accepting chemotaxis protein [Acidovorax sp. CF316]|uniref:methyl-accepting chemotaxis protein n=1 Tax=Acidovorax sp. CF316 TaxID=1144317 RepID=UPI00026BE1CC|nr:methyl-accepting chemotaxis protein [Acidovorax sp. CF316]EJE52866.1 methyl-accepting chemotaxis protein [Acidovorax sp. CF316]
MKFRQKIWALPVSACLVFGLGVSASLVIASGSASQLDRLRHTDNRLLETTLQMERLSEHMDNALEAAAMGDPRRLNEAKGHAQAIEQRLDGTTPALQAAFAAHREHSFAVVEGMMSGQDVSDRVAQRRSAQAQWNAGRKAVVEETRRSVEAGFDNLEKALRDTVLASALTAITVLLVLGLASWLIVRSVWHELGGEPGELRRVAEQVASGQLDWDATPQIRNSLHDAMGQMTGRLRETVATIREASRCIDDAAIEIATGNQDLSYRTERAAGSLQETSGSVQQLADGARASGRAATAANALATAATEAASRGGQAVSQVVASMDAINQSSRHIAEIIGVIDSIAFQTNILALNAAVEAARAGEQGRGFAVVASEVRTLAGRSAEAASQIKALIQASTARVDGGALLVREAGEAMAHIVDSVHQVSQMIDGIHRATGHQAEEIGGVSEAIVQLDGMTQQNAALVEQSAAASLSLQEQTRRLSGTVAVFRL